MCGGTLMGLKAFALTLTIVVRLMELEQTDD